MPTNPKRFNNGLASLIAIFSLWDVFLFYELSSTASQMRHNLSAAYRHTETGELLSGPAGYTSHGVLFPTGNQAKFGSVVRYASDTCAFCKQDDPIWSLLSEKLIATDYDVRVLVPNARAVYPDNVLVPSSAVQEKYVDIGWLRKIKLTGTPTVLIFNRDEGLVWFHQGTLSLSDVDDAFKVSKRWRK